MTGIIATLIVLMLIVLVGFISWIPAFSRAIENHGFEYFCKQHRSRVSKKHYNIYVNKLHVRSLPGQFIGDEKNRNTLFNLGLGSILGNPMMFFSKEERKEFIRLYFEPWDEDWKPRISVMGKEYYCHPSFHKKCNKDKYIKYEKDAMMAALIRMHYSGKITLGSVFKSVL